MAPSLTQERLETTYRFVQVASGSATEVLGVATYVCQATLRAGASKLGADEAIPAMRVLPAVSALLIVVIGLGIPLQALMQAELIRL